MDKLLVQIYERARQNGRSDAGGDNTSTGIAIGDSEEVRISAVEESNSLLVRASPAQWESIHHLE